jgi:capsular exopolysaccharide synthesis family protein
MNKYLNPVEEFEKPIDFAGQFFKYLTYWKWFIISLIVCLALAFIYLKITPNNYEVTTSILLKDDQKGGGSTEMNAFKEMGLFTQKNNVDNELEALNKSLMVEQVVRELGLYATYTRINALPLVGLLGSDAKDIKIGAFNTANIYGLQCPVLVKLPENVLDTMSTVIKFFVTVHTNGIYDFNGVYRDYKYTVKASISDHQVKLPFGEILITRGNFRPGNDMIVEITLQNPLKVAKGIIGQLKMELTSKITSVVNVSFITGNINLGRDFLNKLVEVYNREDMKDQNEMANKTARFIDDRLMTLTNELGNVETKVENYKQDQGLTDIQSQSTMFIQQTGDFAQKRLETGTQLAIVSDIDDYMNRKENRYQLLPASSGIKSEGLNELIGNYNKLILQRNRLSRIATSGNQAMIEMTSQIESMFNTVQSSVRNEKNNLQIAMNELSTKNNENSARIRAMPRQEKEFTEIKRQQGVKEGLFLFLLQKKEEKYLNMSVVEPIAKMIDKVGSDGIPVSPKKIIILLLSIIIGLVIPILGIKIRELLRYQIENKDELEKISVVPVLGEIPKYDVKGGNVIIRENSNDSFTEMVRLLRTNLLFVLDSPDKKVINIVSSISGEGKTVVSINMAMSLALLDKKVLLIGLDIRKPKLDEYLKLDNNVGISLYLSGHMLIDKLVQHSGIHPNLSVIMAGPEPPNPNELLMKPALDILINELRKDFDYIVIDTAPMGVVSDSFTLNRIADVNLYVVRTDYTPKKNIEEATRLYTQNKLKEMFFVLNGTDMSKSGYSADYGKKYGYGYRYSSKQGHTYGYSKNDKK